MKKNDNIIWGIVFIIVGIIFGLKALGIFDFNIFFKGWWTLFIIIPSISGIISEKDKTWSIIMFSVGVLLLLCSRGIMDYNLFWKLLLPIVLIVFGFSIIFRNKISEKVSKNTEGEHVAVFSGQKVSFDKDEFKGTTLTAVFGGVDCDLRNVKIKDDVLINCNAVFGGIDIIVPEDVKVVISSASFFGGAENKRKNNDGKHTIYVNCNCVFGGVDIK